LKKVVISTEDPYALDISTSIHSYYDHIMTNEISVAEGFGVNYLPTAADMKRCSSAMKLAESMGGKQYDVCFIGAVYPERKKMLISVHDMCMQAGLKMFAGGTCKDADIVDMPFFVRGEFTTDNTLLAQASSRICINLFRNSNGEESTDNRLFNLRAESMNPRCYDAPACGSALLTDYRWEVEEIYGNSCVSDADSMAEAVYLLSKGDLSKEIAGRQSKEVARAHTYIHRAIVLLASMEKGIVFT
jgi:hypothetical protein